MPACAREATSPWATEEQFDLCSAAISTSRHADGGMADMDIFEFAAMIEETPVRSRVIEYTEPAGAGGERPAGRGLPYRRAR
jgi:leucyl-tRNA---protein transferase